MMHKIDVGMPRKIRWILRTPDQETPFRPLLRRSYEKCAQGDLAIPRIRTQIGKICSVVWPSFRWSVHLGVDVTIERSNLPSPKALAQLLKRLATREAQNQMVVTQSTRADIADLLSTAEAR